MSDANFFRQVQMTGSRAEAESPKCKRCELSAMEARSGGLQILRSKTKIRRHGHGGIAWHYIADFTILFIQLYICIY